MSDPSKQFSDEEEELIKTALPLVRALIGFGKVSKWLIITAVGLFAGIVLLGESIGKIVSWLKGTG